MFNFRKYKKLCAVLSVSFAGFNFVGAMEKTSPSLSNSQIDMFLSERQLLSQGAEGKVYHCKDPRYVLKEYEEEQDTNLLSILEGKDLGDNLMNVVKVINNRNVVFEYINGEIYGSSIISAAGVNEEGKTFLEHYGLKDTKGNIITLPMNFFIDKWIIGTIEGMEKIHTLTGRYLGDRNTRNFIVKNYGTNEPILVLIDYDFLGKNEVAALNIFINIFLGIMEKNVDRSDKRWTPLYSYLKKIENKEFDKADDILRKVREIKNN